MVFGLSSPQNCTTFGAAGWVCFTFFFVRVELFASFFLFIFSAVFSIKFLFLGAHAKGEPLLIISWLYLFVVCLLFGISGVNQNTE